MENPQLFSLQTDYLPAGDQPTAIASLLDGLDQGLSHQTLLGVTGSGKTFTMANVIHDSQRPALIMAPNKTLAAQLYAEMKAFFPKNAVEYFVSYYDYYQPEAYMPSSDVFIEKDASINEHVEQMRLSATKAILERADTIIIASVSAIYGLGDPQTYMKMMLHLQVGDVMEQRAIVRRLTDMQYQRNDLELARGTFRVRGDVIDIFPAESEQQAVRIELFDDEVVALAWFDPLTGKVIRSVPRLTVYPTSHYVTPEAQVKKAVQAITDELASRLEGLRRDNRLVEAQRLEQRTRYDLEMLQELGYCSGIENYSRHLSNRPVGAAPPTLLDYLPKNALVFIDESHVTIPQIGGMYRGDRARKTTLVDYGFRLPSAMDNRPLKFDEFEQLMPQMVLVSATPGPYEKERSDNIAEQVVRPTGLLDPVVTVRSAVHQVDDLLSEIHQRLERQQRVLVTVLTKRMAEQLSEYYLEHGIRVRYLHSDVDTVERVEIIRDLRLGVFDVLIGINLLREGLDIPEVSLVAILDADKEGFLRSERSIIQTIGRAARHVEGHALLYADKITRSMQLAMDENQRRREKQQQYNKTHGITPRGIQKKVADMLDGAYGGQVQSPAELRKVAEHKARYAKQSPAQLSQRLQALEKQMLHHAQQLEFEQAAKLRDQIHHLRQYGLGMPV